MNISIATTAEELNEVFSFRYAIYIEELEKTFIKHDKEQKILKDEFDDTAFHICLRNGESLIGVVRLRYPSANDRELNRLKIPIDLQNKYRISVSSRMMLRKEYRNTDAVVKLMNYTYDKNIRDGIDFGMIEVEHYLVRMYKKFGFHEIGKIINEYNLERTLMFVNGRDWEHFKNINSSYANVFGKMVNDMNEDMLTFLNGRIMTGMRFILLITEVLVFSGYAWALTTWFKKTNEVKRWELKFIKIWALTFLIAHLSVAAFYPLPSIVQSISGICLFLTGGGLFWWSVLFFNRQVPAVAFADSILTPLKTSGPYRIVRNPFYTSYSLAWIGGTIATGCWWLLISFFCMGFMYWRAAKFEERQWLESNDAEAYKNYLGKTGMFFPRISF